MADRNRPDGQSRDRVDISILVVTWNARDLVLECLKSIATQNLGSRTFEIVAVDDASTDGTAKAIRESSSHVTLVENRHRLGFTGSVNRGLQLACADRVLLTQADVQFVDPDGIDVMMRYLDCHSDVDVVAPRYLNVDGSFQPMYNDFPTLSAMCLATSPIRRFPAVRRSRPLQQYFLDGFDFTQAGDIPQPGLSCALLTRRGLDRVGELDERFPIYYSDVDWCLRARQQGVRIVYVPTARVVHVRGGSTRNIGEDQWRHSVASLVCYFRKHKSRLQTWILQGVLLSNLLVEKLLLRSGERRHGRRLGPRYTAADIISAVRGAVPQLGHH